MRDIIIDAETLDTKDTAVIPSIGARLCNLETGEMGEGFHVKLDVQEQIEAGYTVSADTIGFWMNQGQAARDYLIAILQNKTPTVSRQVGFSMLHQFISSVKNANTWGNGISFDLGLCIREWGQDNLPWEFWNEQDVRSIVSFGRRVFDVQFKKEVQFEGTPHNPLDDATHEAQYLMEYFRYGHDLATGSAIMSGQLHDLQTELQLAREVIEQMKLPAPTVDGARVQRWNPGDLVIGEQVINISKIGESSDMARLRQAMQSIDTLTPLLTPSLDTASLEAIAKEQREVSESTSVGEEAAPKKSGIAFIGKGPKCRKGEFSAEELLARDLDKKVNPHPQSAEIVICFGAEVFEPKEGQTVVQVDLPPPLPVDGVSAEQVIHARWQTLMGNYKA